MFNKNLIVAAIILAFTVHYLATVANDCSVFVDKPCEHINY